MGYGVTFRPYHAPVVRNQITGCLATSLPTMFEEIGSSFDELIGRPAGETRSGRPYDELLLTLEDYHPFKLYSIVATTVARTSNRVFCGPELGRHHDAPKNTSLETLLT